MNKKNYLVYLHSIGFSQRRLSAVFRERENYKEVFQEITVSRLQELGFFEKQIDAIVEKKNKLDTSYIDEKLSSHKVTIVTLKDKDYPKLLKEIANPPYILYVQGQLSADPCIAVIGSRKISSYGKRVIGKIVGDLSGQVSIVSGGAYGCDSQAHITALDSGGNTYAIVGTGIDLVYPVSNQKLYRSIVEKGGAVISVFPIGEPGNPHNFPIRNEIISGLCLGTLVIEAGERSGTLITANLALEQGRDVFVVPGEIDKNNSLGCNALIREGNAKMITGAEGIFEEYAFLKHQKSANKQSLKDPFHIEIHDLLSYESLSSDDIALRLGKTISETTAHISLLELKQVLRKNIEGKYELS